MAQAATQLNQYLFLVIAIAFSIGFLSTKWLGAWDAEFYVHLYIIALFSLSIIAMTYCWWKNSNSDYLTIQGHASIRGEVRKRAFSVVDAGGIIVFFVGSAFNDIYTVVALSVCMDTYIEFDCSPKEIIAHIIEMTMFSLYIATQVMFLIWAANRQFKSGTLKIPLPFLLNIISNVNIIFYIMLDGALAAENSSRTLDCQKWPPLNTTDMHCVNKTTSFFESLEVVGTYAIGFHSEFAVLAISLNLTLFNSASHVTDSGSSVKSRELTRARHVSESREQDRADGEDAESSFERDMARRGYETYTLRASEALSIQRSAYGALVDYPRAPSGGKPGDNQEEVTEYGSVWVNITRVCCRRCRNTDSDSDRCSPLLPGQVRPLGNFHNRCRILAFVSMGFVIIYTVFILLLSTDYGQKTIFAPSCFIANVFYILMLTFVVSLRRQVGKALQDGPIADRRIGVEGGVLFFTHFCLILFIFIASIPSVYYLFAEEGSRTTESLPETVLQFSNIASIFLILAQITIQTKTIFYLNWIRHSNWVDGSTFDSTWPIICFLMVANFGQWFCNTMVEIRTPGYRPTALRYYGKATWATILWILFPFINYYRYQSTTLFAEFLLWGRSARQRRPLTN